MRQLIPVTLLLVCLTGCTSPKAEVEQALTKTDTHAAAIEDNLTGLLLREEVLPSGVPFRPAVDPPRTGDSGRSGEGEASVSGDGGQGDTLGEDTETDPVDRRGLLTRLLWPDAEAGAELDRMVDPAEDSQPGNGGGEIDPRRRPATREESGNRSSQGDRPGVPEGAAPGTRQIGEHVMDTASLVFIDIWTFVWAQLGLVLFGWVIARTVGATLVKDLRALVDKLAEDKPKT